MTEEPAIQVDNVSKVYPERTNSSLLRQEGLQAILRAMSGLKPNANGHTIKGYQALKNISFDVVRGEGIALVGRNGSGKSTLIKLMANIMRPTTGTINVRGRYSALIGLGAGFIQDMTGRKNIYLNAAIYGVPPHETDEIVDQIIEFADIGDFIDHRVREYSSGMRARLGFSVASHIVPDIIMIDEALAVGDIAFRQKCHAKIDELLSENRTLVLASHSGSEVKRLCQRAIWLHNGEMQLDDSVDIVMNEYNSFMKAK